MSKINRVVVMCHKGDVHLTEACIASIRHWNQEIPIFLHKDESRAAFPTKHIENNFNVQIADSSQSSMGNFLSPLFYILTGPDLKNGEIILVHDSDVLWIGNVINSLENEEDYDLLVSGQVPVTEWDNSQLPHPLNRFGSYEATTGEELDKIYFDPDYWSELTNLPLPKMVFNCGHYAYKVGSLKLSDFEAVLKRTESMKWTTREGIRLGDQGATNFIASLKAARGEMVLRSKTFAIWPKESLVKLKLSKPKSPHLAHWAGIMHPSIHKVPNSHIWKHYQREFYKKIPFGKLLYQLWLFRHRIKQLEQGLRNFRLRLLGKGEFVR